MAEAGFIADQRCQQAIDLLRSKQLPDGSYPAEGKYYKVILSDKQNRVSGSSLVSWGPVSKKIGNPWVTRDAELVLSAINHLHQL